MNNIIPFNLNKISFKGVQQQPQQAVSTDVQNQTSTNNTIPSNPAIAAGINVKTPMAYKKLTDINIPGVEKPAALYKLANGQRVVILPKDGPTVVKTYFNVGSMNEPDNLRGISHFIEHNLFNGSKDLKPGEFFKKVSELGAYTNAETGFNSTDYYVKSQMLEDDSLEKIIKIHSDQVQNPLFPEDQMIKERGPVTSEISMYADDPGNTAHNLVLKNLFNIKSSSDDLVAGRIQNINSITRKDLEDYYNTWYTPDNAVTVITGDVDVQKAMDLVSKNFTKPLATKPENRKYETLVETTKPVRTDIKSPNAHSTIINMGFAGPQNDNTKDKIAFEALGSILCNSGNSRLTKALEPLSSDAGLSSEKIGNKTDDKKAIFLTAQGNEENSEKIIKTIYQEIANLAQNPPTQDELNVVKEKLKTGLSSNNETSEGLNSFIGDCFLNNDSNYLANYNQILDNLTPQDIQECAKKYLDLNKVSMCVVHPQDAKTADINTNYTKANEQTKGKTVSFGSRSPQEVANNAVKNVKQYTLPNNAYVAINPAKANGTCFNMLFQLPNYMDANSAQINALTELLNRGSMYKNKEAMKSTLDQKNISLGVGTSVDGIFITADAPNGKLNDSINLAKEVLNNPRFTQEDFNIVKKQMLDDIKCEGKSANDKLSAALFPYLKSEAGKEQRIKDIENLQLNDVINLYNTMLANSSLVSSISGPTEENPQLANDFITGMSQGLPVTTFKPYSPASIHTYAPVEKPQVYTDTEQRNQAQVLQAYKYKKTGNINDEAKITIMNTILGGNSTSRLFSDLRESQKLAYSVHSKKESIGDSGMIKLEILTTTDDPTDPTSSSQNINKSLDGFQKHINTLKTEPVTEEELKKAKLFIKNNILNSLETKEDKDTNVFDGITSPYGVNRTQYMLDAIDKVSAKDVQNAANYVFAGNPITSVLASEKSIKESGLKDTQA